MSLEQLLVDSADLWSIRCLMGKKLLSSNSEHGDPESVLKLDRVEENQ